MTTPNEDLVEWVQMTHPEVHVNEDVPPATATQEAFDEVWSPRGWVLYTEAEQSTATAPAAAKSTASKSAETEQ